MSQSDKWLLIHGRENQFQNKVTNVKKASFQRKGSGIVLKYSLYLFKGKKCSLMNRQHHWPFKRFGKNFNMTLEPFH